MIQSTKMRFKMNLPSPLLSALVMLVIFGNLSFAVEGKAVIVIVIHRLIQILLYFGDKADTVLLRFCCKRRYVYQQINYNILTLLPQLICYCLKFCFLCYFRPVFSSLSDLRLNCFSGISLRTCTGKELAFVICNFVFGIQYYFSTGKHNFSGFFVHFYVKFAVISSHPCSTAVMDATFLLHQDTFRSSNSSIATLWKKLFALV